MIREVATEADLTSKNITLAADKLAPDYATEISEKQVKSTYRIHSRPPRITKRLD